MSAQAKPKRQRRRAEDVETLKAKPTRVTVLDGGPTPKTADNGKISRRGNPVKTKKKAKTANELMFEAWKYIWENRHRRLTKP